MGTDDIVIQEQLVDISLDNLFQINDCRFRLILLLALVLPVLLPIRYDNDSGKSGRHTDHGKIQLAVALFLSHQSGNV